MGTRPQVSNVLFQSQTAWKQQNKLSVRKKTSHIHSTVVPSANSATKQKNKQQLEGLRRLKVLARAPLARLWRDLGGVCQSSSTRRSQTHMHMTLFEKGEWKPLACVNLMPSCLNFFALLQHAPDLLRFHLHPHTMCIFTTSWLAQPLTATTFSQARAWPHLPPLYNQSSFNEQLRHCDIFSCRYD